MRRCLTLGLGVLMLAAFSLRCAPQDKGGPNIQAQLSPLVVTETTIPPPKVAIYQSFGYSGAIEDNTAIIGTPWYDTPWENTGGAWVFVRSGAGNPWTLQAELTASDRAIMDHFAAVVALSGDTAVISAREDDDKGSGSGSVYVFERSGTTWTEKAKLTASDGAAGDHFCVVAISEDAGTIAVGAPDHGGKGAVYVFVGSGSSWTQQAKITAPDGAAGDKFGEAVDISGDTVAIGASQDDDKGTDSGSVYVFERSGTIWSQQAKIVPADGAAGDRFGLRPNVDGDTLVVGAPKDDDKGTDSGSVYVFERSGTIWSQQAKLTASDGAAGHALGWGFLDGNTFAVSGGGAVYVFLHGAGGWVEQEKITNANEGSGSGFEARGTTGTTVLVTALYSDVAGPTDAGYGYTYDLSLVPNGGSCTTPADCASGICAGGTCCSTACAAPCNTCATGNCAPMSAGTEAGSCSGTSACDGAGSCKLKDGESCSASAECVSGICADQTCCNTGCATACYTCASGTCAPVEAGTEDGSCSGSSACDGAGSCKLKSGQSCSTAAECLSGFCVGGICCTTACALPCNACGSGTCAPVPTGTEAGSCSLTSACDGAGSCKLKSGQSCSASVECLSGFCAGGTCCATTCALPCNTCASGTCAPVPTGTEAGSCSGTSACDGAGNCKLKSGESCSAGAECLSGSCVDGYCCDGACDKACESCGLAGKEGTCSPVPSGDDPDQDCSGTDPACAGACDGAGQCAFPATEQSCGTCKVCDGTGACSGTPADDDACGVIDCDLLDTSCKDYEDVKQDRCAALGQCKTANDPATCTSYVDLPCGTPDAGVDAQPEAGPPPAEAGPDMGQPKSDGSGCSCGVGGPPAADLATLLVLAGLLFCWRRRRLPR